MADFKKPVGSLWVKKQKDGTAYFSFELNGKQYKAWKNKSKLRPGANPKWPDFEIHEDTFVNQAPVAKTPSQQLADDECPY